MPSLVAVIATLVALSNALAFNAPEPTLADEGLRLLFQGWTPRPTMKPEHLQPDLRKRTTSSGITLGYDAPDNVCGYIGGSLGEHISADCLAQTPVLDREAEF